MSNIYAMVDTWNAGGTTFTAIQMNVTDTTSAAGSMLMDLQIASASKFKVGKDGSITLNAFASLFGDAANTLALRNGANAQVFNAYNTTDGTNAEFMQFGFGLNTGFFGANVAMITTAKTGTGTQRNLAMAAGSSGGFVWAKLLGEIVFGQQGVGNYWQMSNTNAADGHLIAGTDNTFDIGKSGASRPRNVYIATSVITGATATFHTTSAALTNGAGVATGTLTTAPSAGNPTKWIGINDNGTTRYVPAW